MQRVEDLTFIINATDDVVDVVREESFVVEYRGEHGSNGRSTHLLVVFMLVYLQCPYPLHDRTFHSYNARAHYSSVFKVSYI